MCRGWFDASLYSNFRVPTAGKTDSGRVSRKSQHQFGIDAEIALEQPKQASFGEIAVPIAFQLARALKQPPKKIAADLVEAVGEIPGVAAMEVAGNGYINIRFDRGAFAAGLLNPATADTPKSAAARRSSSTPTSIRTRPRTSAICAMPFWAIPSCACCARAAIAWKCRTTSTTRACRWPTSSPDFISSRRNRRSKWRPLIAEPRFDYLCWDLYARTSQYYKDHPEALAWRAETLHAIEVGRRRTGRTGASGRRCDRESASGDHAAAQHPVRRAAARKRDPASAILGRRLRTAERAQRDLFRNRRQEQRLLGDAVLRLPRRR